MEFCEKCGDQTNSIGNDDESLFIDEELKGPLCSECYDKMSAAIPVPVYL